MPGGGMNGKAKVAERQGRTYLEMALNNDGMNPEFRKRTEAFYGPSARFQKTAADLHHLVYAISEPPQSVDDLIRLHDSKNTLPNNPAVKRTLAQLPVKRAHAVILVDLTRMFSSLPRLANLSISGVSAAKLDLPTKQAPIIGWALEVQKDSVTGHFAMDQDDAVALCKAVRTISESGTPRMVHVRSAVPPKPPRPPEDKDDKDE
jgi:hypothetical protein